jgi:preprotein translocase subunit SecE
MDAKAITVQEKGLGERVSSWPAAVKEYVSDLKMEMRRVTWPSRQQVEGTTVVVIVSVFAFAAYFSLVDSIMGSLIERIFKALSK